MHPINIVRCAAGFCVLAWASIAFIAAYAANDEWAALAAAVICGIGAAATSLGVVIALWARERADVERAFGGAAE